MSVGLMIAVRLELMAEIMVGFIVESDMMFDFLCDSFHGV